MYGLFSQLMMYYRNRVKPGRGQEIDKDRVYNMHICIVSIICIPDVRMHVPIYVRLHGNDCYYISIRIATLHVCIKALNI